MYYKSLITLLSVVAGAIAAPTTACNADNCLRAVEASAFPTRHGAADCSSYFLTTVTPATKTITATAYTTTTTTATATDTTTDVATITNTALITDIDTVTDIVTSVQTVSLTNTALITDIDTVTDIVTSVQTVSLTNTALITDIDTVTDIVTDVTTVSLTTTVPIPSVAARQMTEAASTIPTYASACSGSVRYSSACSCVGVTASTTTVAAPSTTTTTTSTIVMTATVTTIQTSLATATDITTATVDVTATVTTIQTSLATATDITTATVDVTATVTTIQTGLTVVTDITTATVDVTATVEQTTIVSVPDVVATETACPAVAPTFILQAVGGGAGVSGEYVQVVNTNDGSDDYVIVFTSSASSATTLALNAAGQLSSGPYIANIDAGDSAYYFYFNTQASIVLNGYVPATCSVTPANELSCVDQTATGFQVCGAITNAGAGVILGDGGCTPVSFNILCG